jgi:hypothetical protein
MAFDGSYRRILARMGYYDYQHGLIVRHINQDDGWKSHIERCRLFILKAIDISRPEAITVLGSGWLLELPLEEMLERVQKIYLADIIHPPEIVEQISKLPGIEFRTEDLSGGLINELWQKTSGIHLFKKLKSINDIVVPEYKPDYDPGMILSLNILTQLETLPVRQLMKKSKAGEEEINNFRKEIQEKHLDFLSKHRSVLITDTSEVFFDREGNTTEKESVVVPLPDGKYKEEWTWDFDLKGSDYFEKRSVFKVAAIMI